MRVRSPKKISTGNTKPNISLGNTNQIKKAISKTTETQEANNEELENDNVENNPEEQAQHQTELEKKKNLDKLLKRGLTTKENKDKLDKKNSDKESGKEIDKEWQENSKATEDSDKSRFQRAKEDGLQDQLKHDKDSIAKRYPGIERPGSGSSGGNPQQQQQQNNSSSSQQNGSSGISKLSESQGGSGGGYSGTGSSNGNSTGNSFSTRPNFNRGNGSTNFNHSDHVGRGNKGTVDHGHDHGDGTVAHNKFESLFTQGHINGKEIHTGSKEDAARLTSTLRDIGAFGKIEQNGHSIRVSDFHADKSHDVHEAHSKVLGREFLEGNIQGFSFDGVNEDIAGDLTKLLEQRADEIGSENHNIDSSCESGLCKVTVNNNQEQELQQEQQMEQENNSEQQYA